MQAAPPLRHITSINDLSNEEIERVFARADHYLDTLGDPLLPYRLNASTDRARGRILASLFYEPSTRTRLSFESAMLRLGGQIVTSADSATSSVAKGESLADTVRVVSSYADTIVLRHPRDGAARLASEYASVPIINGGDGAHEHPTQTLCDLFTLRRENKRLRNLNVVVSGDLKGSRTIHSFVYALARFGANIMLMPAKGMELPAHVDARLREEFACQTVPREKYEHENAAIDALYVTPDRPHQLSLIPSVDVDETVDVKIRRKIDVVYVTRFQKERWAEASQDYPKIDAQFLKESKYSDTSVLHPLPRVGELDVSLDTDSRALYFRQAAYGVPIRMALIDMLAGSDANDRLAPHDGGFADPRWPLYDRPRDTGMRCANSNCIVHDPLEQPHVRNKFWAVRAGRSDAAKLRCFYCESDVADFVVGRGRKLEPSDEASFDDLSADIARVIFFRDADEAGKQGHHQAAPRRRRA
jgi:aspartate carbamoyltransferase catalytic subunit